MTRHGLFIVTFLSYSVTLGQVSWFAETFPGDRLGDGWISPGTSWTVRNGVLRAETRSYDELCPSRCYTYATQRYSIEVTLRGIRAGIYFSLDNPGSKALSHMLRFDEKSLLAGYFDGGGEYNATSVFELNKLPTDWTILRVDVDPLRRFYAVYVDGLYLGADTNLVFPSGFIGLQASDGISEFQSVTVSGAEDPIPPTLPPLGAEFFFQHVSYVRSVADNLEIYAPELNRIVRLDSDGRWISTNVPGATPELTTSLRWKGRLWSIAGKKILLTEPGGKLLDSLWEQTVAPACLLAVRDTLYVADPGAKAVLMVGPQGQFLGSIKASVLGGFKAPRGLALHGNKHLVIADYDRLVFWDERASQRPHISFGQGGTSATLEWISNSSSPPWLEYAADGQAWKRWAPSGKMTQHPFRAHLKELTPLTRYSIRYSPALKTIPQQSSSAAVVRMSTPPADSRMMSLTRLPVMCMVYRTVSYRDKYPKSVFSQIPDGHTLTDDDLNYLREATVFNREFYFRNSSCRLVLDFDFSVVEDTLWLRDIGDTNPYWLPPNDRVARDFEHAARSLGKSPEAYAGLICPYAWLNYPPRRPSAAPGSETVDTILIRQAVGGGTYGVPAPWKFGTWIGYTSNPFQDRSSRQDWLITHEFHHQIDALMDASGSSDYFHADQPWKMPGRFGEDFDFNAQIIRNATGSAWLTLRFGRLAQTLDEDRDGVPDDDSSLPFDERRLKSNPQMADSDGDHVADLAEVLTGTSRGSDLTNKDTDGDGIQDDIDPEPLYIVDPSIAHVSTTKYLALHPFGSVRSESVSADCYIGWTDSALVFAYQTNRPANLLFQIDANNDGWFHGFDNIQIRISGNTDSVSVADYYLRDCSSWAAPPRDRRDILRRSDMRVVREAPIGSTQSTAGLLRTTVWIPASPHYGFRLERGKRFGIRLGVQTKSDLWVWNELFERNFMMSVELK